MIAKGQSNFIKLVAMTAMAVDHIGAYLFPLDILRIIGRISFPLFAYQIGIGYRMTSSKQGYLKRLAVIGLISQIPFYLLSEGLQLNILFSFILGIFAISFLEKKSFLCLLPLIFLSFLTEYQIYGLITILIFYFIKTGVGRSAAFVAVTALYSFQNPIQIFSVFSLFFMSESIPKINLPRNLFYIFYPFHLAVIYLVRIFLLG